ncbi:hypothetical protein T02_10946 [Trichinella nativa]|uniref:Uncharacterized protein n=1 Tax=Trichinella nativa TaxID=6335 RepID=A0A0V1L2I0_9BILA|nr:hypothetical protein T02_10946 [Trichinella nativa]
MVRRKSTTECGRAYLKTSEVGRELCKLIPQAFSVVCFNRLVSCFSFILFQQPAKSADNTNKLAERAASMQACMRASNQARLWLSLFWTISEQKNIDCSLAPGYIGCLVPSKSNIDGMQWEERLDGEEPKRPRLLFVSEGSSRPPLAAATGVALFSHPAAIASLKTSAAEASCQESALNNA